MALDLQEQDQLDALKAWWKDNGNTVLGALLVVVVAIGGQRGWHYYQAEQSEEAMTLYSGFVRQMENGTAKRVNDAAAALMDQYAGTPYAARAALQAADVNEYSKDAESAKKQLQWVLEHAAEESLKDVARLRLAAILLDEKDFAGAQKLLDARHPASFDGLYADLKGDVLSAQGKVEEARSAYKLAYEKTGAQSNYRNLIQMKLDALGAEK